MPRSAILSSLAVALLWGAGPVFDRFAVDRVDSRLWFVARFYLTFLLMLTPMVVQFDEVRYAMARADRRVLWAWAGSVVLPLAGLYLYYRTLGQAEVSRVLPLCAGFPLATLVLSAVFLREPVTAAKLVGTVLIVSGAWLVVRP